MGLMEIAPIAHSSRRAGRDVTATGLPFRDNVIGLLESVRAMACSAGGPFAILFSFEPLSHLDRLPEVVSDFRQNRDLLAAMAGGELVQVSETDFVLLSDRSERELVDAAADVTMVVLKAIANRAPQALPGLDQSRLVCVLDVSRRRADLFEQLEVNLRKPTAHRESRRAVSLVDLGPALEKIDALGRQEFVHEFARFQPLAVVRPGQAPSVALNEWALGVPLLKQRFLGDAHLQLEAVQSHLLILELDQRLLDCLLRKHIDPRFATVNLDIGTIFTRKFDELGEAGTVRQLIVEVRAGDALRDFDRFLLARKHIRDLGGRIALDDVRPSMLGVLRPARLGCDFIKVFVDDIETASPVLAETMREIHEAGTRVVLAGVESLDAVRAGMGLGVDIYQGAYIETLMKSEGERVRLFLG